VGYLSGAAASGDMSLVFDMLVLDMLVLDKLVLDVGAYTCCNLVLSKP